MAMERKKKGSSKAPAAQRAGLTYTRDEIVKMVSALYDLDVPIAKVQAIGAGSVLVVLYGGRELVEDLSDLAERLAAKRQGEAAEGGV